MRAAWVLTLGHSFGLCGSYCPGKAGGDCWFFKRAWKSLQGRLGGSQLHHVGTGQASRHCLAFSKLAFLLPLFLSPWCSSPGQASGGQRRQQGQVEWGRAEVGETGRRCQSGSFHAATEARESGQSTESTRGLGRKLLFSRLWQSSNDQAETVAALAGRAQEPCAPERIHV